MKALLMGMRVHMTARETIRLALRRDAQGKEIAGDMPMVMKEQEDMITGNFHPLVRPHPETGK